jgi:hypothetical protein
MGSFSKRFLKARRESEFEADMRWEESGKPYIRTDPDGKLLAQQIIENTPSGYIWCFHCKRAFDLWEILVPGFSEYCDCGASWLLDGQDWGSVRAHRPGYPAVPEKDVEYPEFSE